MTFPARLTKLIEKAWPNPWEYKDGWIQATRVTHRHSHFAKVNPENAELIVELRNKAEAIRDLVVAADNVMNNRSVENMAALGRAITKLEEA